MENTQEKSSLTKIGFFLLAVFAFLIFLGKFALYTPDGLPKKNIDKALYNVQIVGENVSADYAVLELLNKKEAAYVPENQTEFVKQDMQVKTSFVSALTPAAAFILRPFQILPYLDFVTQWLVMGIFLYALALYLIVGLRRALFFLYVSPALVLTAVSGGWGLYLAFAATFILCLNPKHAAFKGFILGLTIGSPVAFAVFCLVLLAQKQTKSVLFGAFFAVFVIGSAFSAYGTAAFADSLRAAFVLPTLAPCGQASVYATLLCNKVPVWGAALAQIAVIGAAFYYGVRVFKNRTSADTLNAYVCAVLPLLFLSSLPATYAVTGISALLLWKECEKTTFLENDKILLISAFAVPFFDVLFIQKFGCSVMPLLSAVLAGMCVQRSALS